VAETTRKTCVGRATNAIGRRQTKMLRRFEFDCPACSSTYLRATSEATPCPNPNCKAEYMELQAVIEIAENVGIFTGYPIRKKVTKKTIDK
jgi:hypothetical protein